MEDSTKKWIAYAVAAVCLFLLPVFYGAGRESIKREIRERLVAVGTAMESPPPMAPTQVAEAQAAEAPVVTLAEFNQIQTGMSYEQVTAIIGAPGVEQSRFESPGSPQFGIASSVMGSYAWNNGGIGGNCALQFRDGRVTSKMQFGLR